MTNRKNSRFETFEFYEIAKLSSFPRRRESRNTGTFKIPVCTGMTKRVKIQRSRLTITIMALVCFCLGVNGEAACRNPNLVLKKGTSFIYAAASGSVEIKWFGHAFFQITSSEGTKIITDPFGNMGFPMPDVAPDVVTIGRASGNHNNVGLAKGNPLILQGLQGWGLGWTEINTTFRDTLIYNVPIHTRSLNEFVKGTAFVFEMDGLCICHTGDVGEPFNEDQIDLIGHVDVLLVPIGGSYTMGPENAKKVVEQLKPKVVVPMHYYENTNVLATFLNGPYQARYLQTNKFTVNKDTLPPVTQIYIPKVAWYGRGDGDL